MGPGRLDLGAAALGTMTFGEQTPEDEAGRMVALAREAGVTMFDTANGYAAGRSEEILGRIVAPFRDEVVIATKVGTRGRVDPGEEGLSRAAITRAAESSLRRLGTDRIDLYYLHVPDRDVDAEETLAAVDELVRAGKVLHAGQSNHPAWEMARMRCLAERHGWRPLTVAQTMYNCLARRPEGEYAACTDALGIATVAYNPLAGGLLTGKHDPAGAPLPGTRFDRRGLYRERYWNDAQHAAVARLNAIAHEAGLGLLELALGWVASRPLTSCVLLGASTAEQLRADLEALRVPYPRELDAAVDAVWDDLRGVAPDYWR